MTMLKEVAERRSASWLLFCSTGVLLISTLLYFGGGRIDLPVVAPSATPLTNSVPLGVAETLFEPMTTPPGELTRGNPFYTTYFIPEPKAVPKITSRKVPVQYQGFYRTAEGNLRAFVMLEGKQTSKGLGETLVGEYGISAVGSRNLALTNTAGERVNLEFRKASTLELPINE